MKAFLKQAVKSVEGGFCLRLALLTNAAAFCKVNAYSSIGANKLSVCGNIESIKTSRMKNAFHHFLTLMKVIQNSFLTLLIYWYFIKHLVEFLMWV